MIEFDPDKVTREVKDPQLVKTLFAPEQEELKTAFEKASKASLRRHMDTLIVEADDKPSAEKAVEALREMGAALREVPLDKLNTIVKKLGA